LADYLVDTDILIWVLRGRAESVSLLERLVADGGGPPSCSSLSVLEVMVGMRPGEAARTGDLMDNLEVLPVDSRVARVGARLLARSRAGNPREWIDALIAATAMIHERVLVTYNKRHYPYPEVKVINE